MYLTGIADEAGKTIELQIKAHQLLGWKYLELRTVEGYNLASLPDAKYREIFDKLQQAGIRISCFASGIANWAKKISSDFKQDLDELRAAIPRLHELGTSFVRIMSYPNDQWEEQVWFREVVRRLKELARVAADNNLILVHENCSGWGGRSPNHTLDLLATVDSPALKLVFDTGNPPAEGQDAWDFYTRVKPHIIYVHIKDAKWTPPGEPAIFTYPGAGAGQVHAIVSDLLHSGYTGGFSIEPHLEAVIHLAQEANNPNAAFDVYVEYGRRFIKLLETCKP
jgi:sugar phosphate isomerase/epimerase